jgi:hypothetical protein
MGSYVALNLSNSFSLFPTAIVPWNLLCRTVGKRSDKRSLWPVPEDWSSQYMDEELEGFKTDINLSE